MFCIENYFNLYLNAMIATIVYYPYVISAVVNTIVAIMAFRYKLE